MNGVHFKCSRPNLKKVVHVIFLPQGDTVITNLSSPEELQTAISLEPRRSFSISKVPHQQVGNRSNASGRNWIGPQPIRGETADAALSDEKYTPFFSTKALSVSRSFFS